MSFERVERLRPARAVPVIRPGGGGGDARGALYADLDLRRRRAQIAARRALAAADGRIEATDHRRVA